MFSGSNIIKVPFKVTTCSFEHLLSAMRQVKFYAKSMVVSERLNGVALMHVYHKIVPDIEKVIVLLYTKNRTLTFT